MGTAHIYANFLTNALAGTAVDLTADSFKVGLLGSGYTPDLTSDTFWSDISSHEITGTGYTAGGAAVTSPSLPLTPAASWTQLWAATTGYTYGQIIWPSSGSLLYRCVVAGTSGGSAPTFPTVVGETVVDGSVTWAAIGDAVLVFTSSAAAWTTATFTASYAVIYDTTASDLLVVLNTFTSPQSPVAENFNVDPDPVLGWFAFSPPS